MQFQVSVITPSFNQAEFLPRTLASVSCQTASPIEHLIYDPGSTDASRDIARATEGVVLVAEPDNGQADAVARGMLEAKGDIVAWLNSDDEYYDETVFQAVIDAFASEEAPDIVFGDGVYVDEHGKFLRDAYVMENPEEMSWRLAKEVGVLQPATFISKSLIERIGPVDRDLQFCMDYEFWIRAYKAGAKFHRLHRPLARARYYEDNKTLGQRGSSLKEVVGMVKKHHGFVHPQWLTALADFQLHGHDGVIKSYNSEDVATDQLDGRMWELNRLCNGDFKTESKLDAVEPQKKIGTAKELLALKADLTASAYAEPVGIDQKTLPHHRLYTVGPQRWAFKQDWLSAQLQRSDLLFEKCKSERRGDTCVIVGNGPSLNKIDLNLLENTDTFITNYAYLNKTLSKISRYICVTNYLVAEQEPESFNLIEDAIKFVPYWLSYSILPTENTSFVRSVGHPEFGVNYQENISWRSTVSFFTMQIAYAIGYKKCLLVGFDHSYQQPKSTEGDLIDQREDDPNHFDPRYFKGKTWQAADTDNMEAMYRLAKAAFDKDGREIVNCTVGGKLETFRRGDLAQEIDSVVEPGATTKKKASSESKVKTKTAQPRVLLIDHTRIGDGTASGELKAALFGDWPAGSFRQVYSAGRTQLSFTTKALNELTVERGEDGFNRLKEVIRGFSPELILYRPVPDTPALHEFAKELIKSRDTALATWIFDDWPTSFNANDKAFYKTVRADLPVLLEASGLRLSIGDKMSAVFKHRYGGEFLSFANGIDPVHWPKPTLSSATATVKVRYAGALAKNMTYATILKIAQSVEALAAEGVDISFEIRTRRLWADQCSDDYRNLRRTSFITQEFTREEYRSWLSAADVVVIGYNFDEKSQKYVSLSVANKMPECLSSGAPLLAVGPKSAATLELLDRIDCGVRVTENSKDKIADALRNLATCPQRRLELAQKAQTTAFQDFDIHAISARFAAALRKAVDAGPRAPIAFAPTESTPTRPARLWHVTDTPRDSHAHVDETQVVARLLRDRGGREHVMIDVGAHVGTSAAFFDSLGWKIHCFEPDLKNRSNLTANFGAKSNITIDMRAVSDKAGETLPFYNSPESTGISGLNKFRDTHKFAQRVTTTTVAEIIHEKALERVDFLKIDVEGFDFNVLKGVPWESIKPDVIECEYEDAKTIALGHNWRDIAEYLRDKGYAIYISEWHPIIRYGVQHDWRRIVPYPDVSVSSESWGNILAFREDPGYLAIREAFDALKKSRSSASVKPINPEEQKSQEKQINNGTRIGRASLTRWGRTMNLLQKRWPRLTSAKLFATRVILGLWRRRVWTLPSTLALGGLIVAGAFAESTSTRWLLWGASGFSSVLFVLLYLSLRVYQFTTSLSAENRRLQAALNLLRDQTSSNIDAALKKRLEALDASVSRKLNGEAAARLVWEKSISAESARKQQHLESRLEKVVEQVSRLDADTIALQKEVSEAVEANSVTQASASKIRTDFQSKIQSIVSLKERVVAGEQQIGRLLFDDAPQCVVLFGHHKCGSRFFRFQVFERIAEINDARLRSYKVVNPPFHYSEMDDLDLCNIDFSAFNETGREVVLFANATERSLEKVKRTTDDWRGLRVLRDPRQVLVSNYFHHRGDHNTKFNGWVWDKLIEDQPLLRELPEEDGLIHELDNISKGIIERQLLAPFNDERILTIKLEDFAEAPKAHLRNIATFLKAPEIAGLNFSNNGKNPDGGLWQHHFTSKIRTLFKERYGQALIDLGYAEDFDW